MGNFNFSLNPEAEHEEGYFQVELGPSFRDVARLVISYIPHKTGIPDMSQGCDLFPYECRLLADQLLLMARELERERSGEDDRDA